MFFFILGSYNSFAQERNDFPLPKINRLNGSQLISATGWLYNPEGQWISRKNRIPQSIENQNKILLDFEKDGLGIDNFISFQLKEIKIYDTAWMVLIKKFKSGYYRYETIKEGWVSCVSFYYFVFHKDELKKFDDFKDQNLNTIEIQPFTQGELECSNESSYLSDIEKAIGKSLKDEDYKRGDLVIKFIPNKFKAIVRFIIFGWDSNHNSTTAIVADPAILGNELYISQNIFTSDALFTNLYYECKYFDFLSFIKR